MDAQQKLRRLRNWDRACSVALIWWAINLAGFFVTSAWGGGGEAMSGVVKNGRYYMSSKGRPVEVSAALFNWNLIFLLDQIVTFPITFAAAIGQPQIHKRIAKLSALQQRPEPPAST